jgi:uncharacterized protein (TIGR02246 family)
MTFRETLRRHLQAIQDRDLAALADTVADDGLVLIMADGRLLRRTDEFLEAHRGWFGMKSWTLQAREVRVFESAGLAVAVLELDYREPPAVHSRSYLTLVFEKRGERWLMVQDQNTPITQ